MCFQLLTEPGMGNFVEGFSKVRENSIYGVVLVSLFFDVIDEHKQIV